MTLRDAPSRGRPYTLWQRIDQRLHVEQPVRFLSSMFTRLGVFSIWVFDRSWKIENGLATGYGESTRTR